MDYFFIFIELVINFLTKKQHWNREVMKIESKRIVSASLFYANLQTPLGFKGTTTSASEVIYMPPQKM